MNNVSKRFLSNKLDYWEAKKIQLKNTSVVKAILDFENLSPTERQESTDEWDSYFRMVRTTKAYQRYIKVREAFKRNDPGGIKEVLATKQDGEELAKPRSLDYEGERNSHKFISYKQALSSISHLKGELAKLGDTHYLADEVLT